MNPPLEELNDKLSALETITGVSEHNIKAAIEQIRNPEREEEPCPEWQYESLAFSLSENCTNKNGSWGTYFGPFSVWYTDDGQTVENPSISQIDQNAINYWSARSELTKNPLLKARYADLVWDLSKQITGKSPDVSFAVEASAALIQIAEKRLHKSHAHIFRKLERALAIALSISNKGLIERAKKTIIDYESHIAEDSKLGRWGYSFDLLIENKKVNLSSEDEKKIIGDMESRLSRLQTGDPWACEHAAGRLAKFYRSKNLSTEVKRVISVLGSTFEHAAEGAAPLLALSLLEQIHSIYLLYNLKGEAERVAKAIRTIGPKILEEMKPIWHKLDIPQEEFDQYVEQCVQETMEESLKLIASIFIPERDQIKKQLSDLAKVAPLNFLFTKQLTDDKGRILAKIGSLEDDSDGNIVSQMHQNMVIHVPFLSSVLDRAVDKYEITTEKFLHYIFSSPIFAEQQKEFVSTGVEAYLQKRYTVAIHLIVPQIEAAISKLVEMSGGSVLKIGRSGGFHLRTLDELLRSQEVSTAMNEDVALYMRVLLSDPRGWNIRNTVCHGIASYEQMCKGVADRLIHVLLMLALLRIKEV
jgi:hypothetical protein